MQKGSFMVTETGMAERCASLVILLFFHAIFFWVCITYVLYWLSLQRSLAVPVLLPVYSTCRCIHAHIFMYTSSILCTAYKRKHIYLFMYNWYPVRRAISFNAAFSHKTNNTMRFPTVPPPPTSPCPQPNGAHLSASHKNRFMDE